MAKIGCFTFGGGWSIIGQIQIEFVEKRKWMTEEEIIDFMSLAKSFPGIMIINMSVLCGYAMEGAPGALAAAFGLAAPAVAAIGLVTYFYDSLKSNLYVEKVLNGVRCVVIPIILQASWKLKDKSLTGTISCLLLAVSFGVCAFTDVSKPLVMTAGALLGLWVWRGGKSHGAA
ncbi:MAG: chromate transporter [Hungatella sp.]|nr:chromate transporter [Hungatella sp.]